MERAFYLLTYRLEGGDQYLLWYNGDPDGVLVDHEQRVLSFASISLLRSWAQENRLPVMEDPPALYDLDSIRQWSAHPDPKKVDCGAILSAWNLFIDIRSSVERRNAIRDDPGNDDLYQKVFWGSNLPSVTPDGKSYVPTWSDAEVIRIGAAMNKGLHFFQVHLRYVVSE